MHMEKYGIRVADGPAAANLPEPARAVMEYLNCECIYFPAMEDDDPVMEVYRRARQDSTCGGFVPVLVRADDEILWECLIMNSDPDSDGEEGYSFDPKRWRNTGRKCLTLP